jgi:hypothetical protein
LTSKPGEGYFARSRSVALSCVAIAPVAAFYEVGLVMTNAQVVNGAELLLRSLFMIAGPVYGPIAWRCALGLAVLTAAVVVVRGNFKIPGDILGVIAEGCVLGLLLGPAALWIQGRVSALLSLSQESRSLSLNLALALGAGVYEEVLFRLILLSALYTCIRRVGSAGSHPVLAAAGAVVISAVLFSGFHHWPGGEPFAWQPFCFRAIAGLALGGIFIARGLGVAVYTHAAYDLLVVLSS